MVIFELVNVGFRDLNSYNDKELKLNSLNKQQYTYLKWFAWFKNCKTLSNIYLFSILFTIYTIFFYDLGSRFLVQMIMAANGKCKK